MPRHKLIIVKSKFVANTKLCIHFHHASMAYSRAETEPKGRAAW